MTTQTTERNYQISAWSLTDLFAGHDTEDMTTAFSRLEESVEAFEGVRSELADDISVERLLEIIKSMEENIKQAFRVFAYSSLWVSEDTQNQTAATFQARVQQFFAGMQNRTMFFELWWKALDDETAQRLMSGAGEYAYYLKEMRNFKPHTLTESEEKVINIKNLTGSNALKTLYSTITNRYTFKLMVDGEEQELTRAGVMAHAYSLDPDMRAAAYQELYRVYGEDGVVLGQIYQSLVRDWRNENIDMRKFSSPISVRNLVNDIPDDVINILLDVSEKNAPLFHRFFKLKAKWLGVEKIRRYDLYAPMTKTEKKYEFSEAADLVLDTFAEFDGTVAEMANRVFAENHLDSEIRKGKRGGAFCMPMHQITPWVLMNYLGDPRDVATLAHELGHAIHSMLADRNPLFAHNPSLPLAETASTFSEMLLVDKMLAEETDESVRVDLLFRQVDDAYATIMRQVFFALFERRAHDMIQNGASVDDLCDAYMENLKTQFGDSIELGEEFKWEWVSIPHIYNVPFYVYAYAFGQLLVFALYQQFKAEGDSFKPRYLEILASGGSASTVDILAKAGVDIRTAEFWQGGYDVIAALVDELETIEKPE